MALVTDEIDGRFRGEPGEPSPDAEGGWDAEAVRGYEEHILGTALDHFKELYGFDDLVMRLRIEGERLGFGVSAND